MMTSINQIFDLEQGAPTLPRPQPSYTLFPSYMKYHLERFKHVIRNYFSNTTTKEHDEKPHIQIEDYPRGYPRFSALIAAHESFHVFRRFGILRVRLLLRKQDKLSVLEQKLEQYDKNEAKPIYLCCNRRDKNEGRANLMDEIETELRLYDDLLCRSLQTLKLNPPDQVHVRSLKNWLQGNACISREESQFLHFYEDLLTASGHTDSTISWIQRVTMICLKRIVPERQARLSRDPKVTIYTPKLINNATRFMLTPILIFIVLAPTIVCNRIESSTARLCVMIGATTTFITLLALLTKSRTIELAVAGATYATVLIAFVAVP